MSKSVVSESDRLPPHDCAAEQGVLGCILLDSTNVMPKCIETIGSRLETFYDLRNQEIYRVMTEMYDAQESIDTITLNAWLGFQGLTENTGGVAYLAGLSELVPSAANVDHYLGIITAHYKARKLIALGTEVVSRAFDASGDADELISRASTQILQLAQDSVPRDEEASAAELVPIAQAQIEAWLQSEGTVTGVRSGLTDLDRMTTGFQPGEMILIAGRPGSGKTSVAMNIVDHAAVEQGIPVGVFSLEMTRTQLMVRMICSRARVNVRNIKAGMVSHGDFSRMTHASIQLSHSKIHINDQGGLSIGGLRARARRMHQQYGIGLFVIDYLQLMSSERRKNDNREQEVAAISGGVKGLAKDLGVPVIALSQLNRVIERDKVRRPRMSDLRESGSLENDSDFVGILWCPANDDDDEPPDQEAVRVNLEVCKQRNGPTGTVPLTFLRSYTRFESAARVEHDGSYPNTQQEPVPQEPDAQPGLPI